MAHNGFALCPVRCLKQCRVIQVRGTNGGKKGISLWVRTELGQVEGSEVDDFPGRKDVSVPFSTAAFTMDDTCSGQIPSL